MDKILENRLIIIEEASEYLGVNKDMIRNGKTIPAHKIKNNGSSSVQNWTNG